MFPSTVYIYIIVAFIEEEGQFSEQFLFVTVTKTILYFHLGIVMTNDSFCALSVSVSVCLSVCLSVPTISLSLSLSLFLSFSLVLLARSLVVMPEREKQILGKK